MKTTLENLATTGGIDPGASPAQAQRLQVLALVEQFEGMLLTEMLKGFGGPEEDGEDGALGLGGSTLSDMMRGEFGMALSRAGGMGLGEMLSGALLRTEAAAGATPATDATVPSLAPSSVAPAIAARSALAGGPTPHDLEHDHGLDLVADASRVSSNFGLRRDPFTGETRFHRGVDLALAYGSEVRSFGDGVVTSAGERPGYGLTVVVDHGQGRETLYAHLSAIDVEPGQSVTAGQRLAQSGRSGRATGPHLHVEAREFGQAVDIGRVAAVWNGRSPDTSVGGPDN